MIQTRIRFIAIFVVTGLMFAACASQDSAQPSSQPGDVESSPAAETKKAERNVAADPAARQAEIAERLAALKSERELAKTTLKSACAQAQDLKPRACEKRARAEGTALLTTVFTEAIGAPNENLAKYFGVKNPVDVPKAMAKGKKASKKHGLSEEVIYPLLKDVYGAAGVLLVDNAKLGELIVADRKPGSEGGADSTDARAERSRNAKIAKKAASVVVLTVDVLDRAQPAALERLIASEENGLRGLQKKK